MPMRDQIDRKGTRNAFGLGTTRVTNELLATEEVPLRIRAAMDKGEAERLWRLSLRRRLSPQEDTIILNSPCRPACATGSTCVHKKHVYTCTHTHAHAHMYIHILYMHTHTHTNNNSNNNNNNYMLRKIRTIIWRQRRPRKDEEGIMMRR